MYAYIYYIHIVSEYLEIVVRFGKLWSGIFEDVLAGVKWLDGVKRKLCAVCERRCLPLAQRHRPDEDKGNVCSRCFCIPRGREHVGKGTTWRPLSEPRWFTAPSRLWWPRLSGLDRRMGTATSPYLKSSGIKTFSSGTRDPDTCRRPL